ncbi:MAG: signal peptide peptidase SppA [Planctomycetota bacterium]|nr:signal peptide peptidase SppA [Planctomycetota bacterium]
MINILSLILALTVTVQGSPVLVDDTTEKEATTVRLFELKGGWSDQPDSDPSLDITSLMMGNVGSQRSFPDLIEALESAFNDEEIDAVVLDLSGGASFSMPQIANLCDVLDRGRDSGKKILAWMENATTSLAAIGSSCHTIFLTETGGIDLYSPSMMPIHFKTAMDLFGVEASVIRVGDFKGAVEPFMLPQMSDHLRDHYLAMLESMNRFPVERIAAGRNLDTETVRELQGIRIFTAKQALEAGLVDLLAQHGTLEQTIEGILDGSVEWIRPGKKRRQAVNPFQIFTELFSPVREKKIPENSIAILHLSGEIVDGDTATPGSMVSEPSAKVIDALADNDSVMGVVVRIDSPGGSATASEVIRLALENLASKKPMVYSMGNLAASGGYWITCTGKPIYASEGTITGSIGVFGMKLSFGPALKQYGIHFDPVALDESATMMFPNRGWNDAELARLQGTVDDVYDDFISRVSESRDINPNRVREIAGGRVWSGGQAVELGLVDAIGGIEEAVAHVKREAELEGEVSIVHRPGPIDPLQLFDLFGGGDDEAIRSLTDLPMLKILAAAGVDLRPYLARLVRMGSQSPFTVEARMPIDLNPRF